MIDVRSLTNDELKKLIMAATLENKRRQGNEKGSFGIYSALLNIFKDEVNSITDFPIGKIESSIIKICDCALGNYKVKTKSKGHADAVGKTEIRIGRFVKEDIAKDYNNMVLDILDLISSYRNIETRERKIDTSTELVGD